MKKILSFTLKNIIVVFFIFFIASYFNTTTIIVPNNQYLTQYTYYYPGDATGSGFCTGSGKCIDSFTTDENGWYFYETNGEKYLVIAAALNICKNSLNHCGIDVNKHGIAKNVNYYDYYDVLNLSINGKTYKAMVLDACGACMWRRQDDRGQELFDIFVSNGSAKKPNSNDKNNSLIGNQRPDLEHFGTSYTGDITKGWIYERFEFSETFNHQLPDYKAESNINDVIDEIFDRAKTSYFSTYGSSDGGPSYGYSAQACSDLENKTGFGSSSTWKQGYDLWAKIPIGNSNVKAIGCLVTSIAIQIDRMGVNTGINNFNPGTFACYLSKNGSFTSGGALYHNWVNLFSDVSLTAGSVTGTKTERANQIQNLINDGCYLVLYAPHSGNSHYVAVSGTTVNDITIMDPGSNYSTLWGSGYYDFGNSTSYRCLKKVG